MGDGNPFTYSQSGARPGPRGNVREWIRTLGVDWEPTRIVWDSYNPHPDLAHMPEDVVFLGAGNENEATFNAEDAMTSHLQELVFLYPGFLHPDDETAWMFEPLLRTGMISGTNGYFSLVRGTPYGPQVNPSPPRDQDDDDYIVAARVRSADSDEWTSSSSPTSTSSASSFFQIREQAPGGLNFDNITFFLNAMDTLLEEDAFIDLRSRRAATGPLERVEAQTAEFIEQRTAEEQQAEAEAEAALTEAHSG